MKLVSFKDAKEPRLGFSIGDRIVDALTVASYARSIHKETLADWIFPRLETCLENWQESRQALQEALKLYEEERETILDWAEGHMLEHSRSDVTLAPPVSAPQKILCCGVNYHDHVKENPNAVVPELPFFFSKLPSALIGDREAILLPEMSLEVDYEVEVAAVIGRGETHIGERDALSHVAGYALFNDVSARDIQFKDQQITLGKNFDTFAPMGPYLITADEAPQVNDIEIKCILSDLAPA